MRGKSSSKEGMEREMEIEKMKEQQPHLSGAYIRTLVKQLSHNSINKDSSINPKLDEDVTMENINETQQSQPPQQHKKQVRRRLHTTRPYQERLLNMAEARREIVTALKFHRASMKQQQEQGKQKPQVEEVVPPVMSRSGTYQAGTLLDSMNCSHNLQPSLTIQEKPKSRRNKKNYEPNNTNYFENFSSPNFSYCPPPPYNPYNTTYSIQENFMNFALPNQALGLNLNLQDFNNLETTIYNSSNCPSIYYSSSSPSSSSSPPTSSYSASQEGASMVADYMDIHQGETGMHPRMDDNDMAEIRSIGDQHQMELNDTLNLVSSAWWSKFLKSMEIYGNDQKTEHPFDEIMELPTWLSANESCLQQHLQDYYSDDYFKDPDLPCMEIEEIEAMDDGKWLS